MYSVKFNFNKLDVPKLPKPVTQYYSTVLLLHNYVYAKSRFFLLLVVLLVVTSSYSQYLQVPENIQAALIPKVLKYNPKLSNLDKLKMLVVYDNNSAKSKNEFLRNSSRELDIKAVYYTDLEPYISNYNLVYFMPGTKPQYNLCRQYKVLSVTGTSDFVENGQVSIGFGLKNNKPIIFVNLSSLEKEGQSLSTDILRIAKIYK